jgi:DNA-binding MarR family transcriptional regulator
MFRVLTPRELSVYFYLCSMFGDTGTAYPLTAQIARDLGLSNRSTVKSAIERLIAAGFLLRHRVQVGEGKERTVYQRPAMESTLIKLLDEGAIDGWLLVPSPAAADDDESGSKRPARHRHEVAVVKGLRNLTGLHAAVDRYAPIVDPERKEMALRWLLDRSLAERRRVQQPPF